MSSLDAAGGRGAALIPVVDAVKRAPVFFKVLSSSFNRSISASSFDFSSFHSLLGLNGPEIALAPPARGIPLSILATRAVIPEVIEGLVISGFFKYFSKENSCSSGFSAATGGRAEGGSSWRKLEAAVLLVPERRNELLLNMFS